MMTDHSIEKELTVKNKQIGALLFGVAGMVAAIGVAAAQIAQAIVLAGFYAGNMSGEVPTGPQNATLHWLVITAVITLAAIGLFYLFRPASQT
jgi:hypothetical protein